MVRLWLVSWALVASVIFFEPLTIATWALWACVEWWPYFRSRSKESYPIGGFKEILHLYGKSDALSVRVLESKIREMCEKNLTKEQQRWIQQVKYLVELRSFLFSKHTSDRPSFLRTHFMFTRNLSEVSVDPSTLRIEPADIADAATFVADLHWKLFDIASHSVGFLNHQARDLYQEIFQEKFERGKAEITIGRLTDVMQRHGGIPYLCLNLIRRKRPELAQGLMRYLVSNGSQLDEQWRSRAYWFCELAAFKPKSDFDESIKHLYHYCFVSPSTAEFLEIDSPYFSQFETFNEMAREGFLYKESLIEEVLEWWHEYEIFGNEFRNVVALLLECPSKIYDRADVVSRHFDRLKSDLSKEYLWVIEGNLAYVQGNFSDALSFYDESLKIDPKLPVALMNRVFAAARIHKDVHGDAVQRMMSTVPGPKSLYVAGDSYLLLGEEKEASQYFERLRELGGWDARVEYYQSVFCFDQELFDLSIKYGERALSREPNEASVRFHLSRCYKACGENERALEMVGGIDSPPPWVNYYRFTLERDTGKLNEASMTLIRIPRSYLEEESVMSSAVEFAKGTSNLALLRHLKSRG